MLKIFHFYKNYFYVISGILLINLFLYVFIINFHRTFPLERYNYLSNAHHYLKDKRIEGEEFNFLRALGQFDAQWYLKTASRGYPKSPNLTDVSDKNRMEGLTYAFFPLYPSLIKATNILVPDLELAAFILTNILMILNALSLYYVITKLYSQKTAYKTVLIMFLFPFSIFFRSYFAEGLQLLLLIWFSYFWIKERFFFSSLLLSLLCLAKGNSIIFIPFFLLSLFQCWREKKIKLRKLLVVSFVSILGIAIWILFNYINTGHPFYFYNIQKAWVPNGLNPPPPFYTLMLILNFAWLPLHSFHYSKIDVIIFLIFVTLLFNSKKILKKELWTISLLTLALPLFTRDLMSFSRYQSVSFPLFIYLATILKPTYFYILAIFFGAGLLVTSLFFINWYWIG